MGIQQGNGQCHPPLIAVFININALIDNDDNCDNEIGDDRDKLNGNLNGDNRSNSNDRNANVIGK